MALGRSVPLFNFAFHPSGTWDRVAEVAKDEPWGRNNKVLELYLRANFEIAKQQSKVFENKDGKMAFWRAGYLVNETSDPIWMVYHENRGGEQYWRFKDVYTGDTPIEGLDPEKYLLDYKYPKFNRGWDIHFEQRNIEHILLHARNLERLRDVFKGVFNCDLNSHLVFRAIYGEIQLKRKEEAVIPQYYRGDYHFIMPLYLLSGDKVDLTATLSPDDVNRRYSIRTLLLPAFAYAYARAVIKNRDQFAHWMQLPEDELDIDVSVEDEP